MPPASLPPSRPARLKWAEHFFKNLALDAFLALRRGRVGNGPVHLTAADTVVFLRLNGIGDALVSTPCIQAIKKRFGCRTVVVADVQNHFIFTNNPSVDHVVVYRKGPLGLWRARRDAQAFRPTAVVDLHEQLSTTVSLLAGVLSAPCKVSLHKRNAALFTHPVPDLDPASHHVVERLAHLGEAFGPAGCPGPLRLTYRAPAAATRKAQDFLRTAFPGASRFVGLNTSAGGDSRFWGVDNYRRLADALRADGWTPVVLASPADRERVAQALDPAPVFCSASFDEFAAVIGELAVLVSPDTAAVHVAAAYGIPVFGLYVAERVGQLNWYPYGSHYEWIIAPSTIKNIPFADAWAQLRPFLQALELPAPTAA